MMKIKTILTILLVCLVLLSSNVFAANYYWCGSTPEIWTSRYFSISAASASFPVNGKWWNALSTAIARVYANPSRFYLGLTGGDTSIGLNNGQSEIWFSSDPFYTPAMTYNWSVCNSYSSYIYETDVIFYNGINYTAGMVRSEMWGYGGTHRPFETTAVHELGHSTGLAHTSSEYNIMGTDYYHVHANGDTLRSYLGEDAADGLVYLYGAWTSAKEDLSLAHWKRIGASGEYSKHGHTEMFSASGTLLSSFLDTACSKGCEKRYNVDAGQTIQLELTAENSGKSTLTPRFGYYISTNNSITTADTLLTTESYAIGRNDVYTYKKTLTIPANLPSGDYWIGAIINDDGVIVEETMANNAMSTPIRVQGVSNLNPTANPNGPYSGGVGVTINFSSAGSTDPDGTIASYLWDFGDGSTSTVANPTHSYAAVGTYTVTLTVTDDMGATGSATTTADITSGIQDPIANANGPYSAVLASPISFSSAGSSGNSLSFSWDFGDGGTSTLANPSYTYSAVGTYTVTLTVTDINGITASNSTTAEITDNSQPSIADACISQTPRDYIELQNGTPVCVTDGAGDTLFFYFNVDPGITQVTIRTEHGTGNADLFYSNSTWPDSGQFTLSSTGPDNKESIVTNNIVTGWNYISIEGDHSGLTVQVDMQ